MAMTITVATKVSTTSAGLRIGDRLESYMGSPITPSLLVLDIHGDRMYLSDELTVHLDMNDKGQWVVARWMGVEAACREIAQWL